MPANIDTMMYVGEKPWHGLGVKLDKEVTAEQAILTARLDWEVEKRPAFYQTSYGGYEIVKNRFAVVRKDTGTGLGIVGARWTALQNRQAFSFFDAVVGLKEAVYHTAGGLGEGEVVWILAKLNGVVRVVGDDITEKYLLLTNRHDGWGSVKVLWTPIRVVCQNTLNLAIGASEDTVKLRHTASIGLKVDEVRKQLGIVNQRFEIFEEASRKLSRIELNTQSFKNYLKQVYPQSMKSKLSNKTQTLMEEVSELFEVGRGADMKGVKGTLWGAFNAVVEHVDYYGSNDLDKRATKILFGSGREIKQRAWDKALGLVK